MVESGILLIVAGCAVGFWAFRAWQGKVTRAWRGRVTDNPARTAAANKGTAPLVAAGSAALVVGGVVAAVGSEGVAEVAIFTGGGLWAVLLLLSAIPARRASRNFGSADRG